MFKIKNKIRIIRIFFLGIILIPQIVMAAAPINFGTLDVKMADQQEQLKINLNRGEKIQKELQISNYSSETKHLKIYVADAEQKSPQSFVAKDKNELSEDIFPWIKLPADSLDIKGGESKILSVNIFVPQNAGVGMHTGAIMVSEKQGDGENLINLEKGLRIYLNINGTPAPGLKFLDLKENQTSRYVNFSPVAVNSGNVDLRGEVKLSILDQDNQVISEQSEKIYLKPGQNKEINLFAEKPFLGFYKVQLDQNLSSTAKTALYSGNEFFYPVPIFFSILGIFLGFALIRTFKKFDYSNAGKWLNENRLILQRSGVFAGLFIFTAVAVAQLPSISQHLYTDLFSSPALSGYRTTVKWGNMEQLNLDSKYKVSWKGYLNVKYGKFTIIEKLNNETNDNINLNNDGDQLSFENQTGPDNDGIILQVDPTTSDQIPVLTYKNTVSKETYDFPVTETLYNKELFRYKMHSIEIKSDLAPEKSPLPHLPTLAELEGQQSGGTGTTTPTDGSGTGTGTTPTDTGTTTTPTDNGTAPTDGSGTGTTPTDTGSGTGTTPTDGSGTGTAPTDTTPIQDQNSTDNNNISNQESTPEINTGETGSQNTTTEQPSDQNTGTTNEIIQDIPSSPELKNFIIAKDLIKEIDNTDNSETLQTNQDVLEKLKDNPTVIKDMISSPDLNFIFVANQKINFSPQPFSFNESKKTSQDLGELIFVQNRSTNWNTYLTITDFVSLSGKGTIPASAVTIKPGEIKVISEQEASDILQAGTEKTLSGTSDQVTLVSVQPKENSKAVFVMRPRISLEIPPGTTPGTYRAEISIKVI